MLSFKKHLSVVITCFLLTLLLSAAYVRTQEILEHITPEPQKVESIQKEVTGNNQPHLVIPDSVYNAGEVYESDEIVHLFTVKNTGTSELVIKDVKAGWGCIVANFDTAIAPGQEGKVTLNIKTQNRKGALKESATVFSNDPLQPKTQISINGSVKPYISIEPHFRIFLRGFAGEDISQKVTITSFEEQPLIITDLTSTIEDKIKHELTPIEEGKVYSLEIKTHSGLKESFEGKVVLKTNSQKKPELELHVIAKLNSEVRVAPQYVYFGIIDTSKKNIDPQSLKRNVIVSKVRGTGLSIEKIESSQDWIKTEIKTERKGEKYSVVITLVKDKLPPGTWNEKITMHTKYDSISEKATVIVEVKGKWDMQIVLSHLFNCKSSHVILARALFFLLVVNCVVTQQRAMEAISNHE